MFYFPHVLQINYDPNAFLLFLLISNKKIYRPIECRFKKKQKKQTTQRLIQHYHV